MNRRASWAIFALALTTGACTQDSTTVETNLSVAQAQAVATQLFVEVAKGLAHASYNSSSASVRTVSTSAVGSAPISFTFDTQCALGGRIRGNGLTSTVLSTPGNGTVGYVLTFAPLACVVPGGAKNITISGDPSIAMSWSTAFANGKQSGNIDYTVTGGMVWDEGSCKLDYHIVYTPAGVGTLSGTVCGQTVDKTF